MCVHADARSPSYRNSKWEPLLIYQPSGTETGLWQLAGFCWCRGNHVTGDVVTVCILPESRMCRQGSGFIGLTSEDFSPSHYGIALSFPLVREDSSEKFSPGDLCNSNFHVCWVAGCETWVVWQNLIDLDYDTYPARHTVRVTRPLPLIYQSSWVIITQTKSKCSFNRFFYR